MPEVRVKGSTTAALPPAEAPREIAREADPPPSSEDDTAPPTLPRLPMRARDPSRPPLGVARPRRVFVTDVAGPQALPVIEAKPTLLSKATVPGFARVDPVRLPASVAPSHPMDASPTIPVVEARRAPPQSRGLAMDRLVEILPGRTVAGRYQIEELIGRGAMGVIFSASDISPSAEVARVALKVLDPEIAHDPAARERFRTEALAAARIASAHVVRVFDADVSKDLLDVLLDVGHPSGLVRGSSEGVPFIAMEMLYGHDLREYLRERGPLRARELVLLMMQLAVTLDKAHALGIVHRDLKPANLFLTRAPDGSSLLKVLDFGVAQLTLPSTTAARQRDAGLFGTPWYMAPEQASGQPATAASDRWALALIVFRLLTGDSYWAPAAVPDLLGLIERGVVAPPSLITRDRGLVPHAALGRAFDAWFFRACALAPEDRFRDAVSQIDALATALAEDAHV